MKKLIILLIMVYCCGCSVKGNKESSSVNSTSNTSSNKTSSNNKTSSSNIISSSSQSSNIGGSDTEVFKPIFFGDKLLENSTAVIEDDAESLAIELKTQETITVNNKGYLVYFDKNNDLKQVIFLYEYKKVTQTLEGEVVIDEQVEITQEELKAQISNIFVTKIFTYITFIPNNYTDYTYNKFTSNTTFMCDNNHQSFIIDNKTHKLYPTNAIGSFTKIRENFVVVDNKYYELSIDDNGNLTSRKLIPNDKVIVSDLMVDKYGNIFVLNSAVNEVVDNYFYYTTNRLYLGTDNIVYSIENIDSDNFRIKYYNDKLELNLIPKDLVVKFGQYLIKNNNFYYLYSESWIYHIKINNGQTAYKYGESYTYNSNNIYLIAGYDVFEYHLVNGNKALFYFNTLTNKSTTQEIITFTNLKISNEMIVITTETLNGTKIFVVYRKNDSIIVELLVDITYKNEIITIQPLN